MKIIKEEINVGLFKRGEIPDKYTPVERHSFVYCTPSYPGSDLIDLHLDLKLKYRIYNKSEFVVEYTTMQKIIIPHPMLITGIAIEKMIIEFIQESQEAYGLYDMIYSESVPFNFNMSSIDLQEIRNIVFRFVGN